MRIRFAATLIVLTLALAPAVSVAQSPFGGGSIPAAPAEPEPTATKQEDGGLAGWQTGLMVLAGVVLLAGIWMAISRDARGHAEAVADGHEENREMTRAQREAEHHRRKQVARKKGKEQKRARRANRPRKR